MRNFLVQVGINAVALWIASWILPGMNIAASAATGIDATLGTVLAYLFVGLIFGLVNALVKPIVKLLSLPVTILTLGLFTIVINAAMLWLTSWLSSYSPVQFTIDEFFWTAILAALIISFISMLAGGLTRSADRV
ncbi:phage holin family protein [Arthrobacter glacialis]|uniref:Phage holin family protein n=1 Tax=Arthrobacter glacialis TaxID=1664 RepID=A0A2S3ZSM2_ARTGL|nr:phage holin family protein [Arthrobacter glacialis]POH57072.1 hypothetical protein CVS28_17780 [Arthrobacter glacialis]POH72094.1 hypothetical protein CVS27_17360 [Arthrobacter glacialis]